jgi:hypothetical protein
VAKVGDFGLSLQLPEGTTHVTGTFQGTLVSVLLMLLARECVRVHFEAEVQRGSTERTSKPPIQPPAANRTPSSHQTHMAPEVMTAGRVSKASDVYAVSA